MTHPHCSRHNHEALIVSTEVTPYWGQTAGTMVWAEVRDGPFVARKVTFENQGDRSDHEVKAVAYDKVAFCFRRKWRFPS